MLARSFLIESASKLLVTMTGIKARPSLISGQIRLLTLELLALEWWNFTLSNLNISEASWPILIKFYVYHHWGWGKAALCFEADWIKTLVSMATESPHWHNGENGISTFSRLLLIRSFLYLQVTRTCIKSRTSSNFDQIGPLTTELAALERLKHFP